MGESLVNTNKVIDLTKRINERELKKIPEARTRQQLLQEIIDFIDEQNRIASATENANEEDFFEFLLLMKTELQYLKEKNTVQDYKISADHKEKQITIKIMPVVPIDRIDMKVIVSSGEYDQD